MSVAAAIDVLFPRECACCGNSAGDEARYLCWSCIARIPVIRQPVCRICGYSPEGTIEQDFICSACSRRPPRFDLARSAFHYTGVYRELMQDFKYNHATWLAHDIGSLMAVCLKTHFSDCKTDVVMPVPLHPAKQRERSYNQSALLALSLARCAKKPLCANMLFRTRRTKPQTHLTARERRVNVRNAFSVKKRNGFNAINVLLVDDVMTTGATLNDCARALKEAGAKTVAVVTAARGGV